VTRMFSVSAPRCSLFASEPAATICLWVLIVGFAGAGASVNPDLSCIHLCNMSSPASCDLLSCKSPRIPLHTALHSESIESGLDNATKAQFEFGVADALASTSAVKWTIRQFGVRVFKMIRAMATLNGTGVDEALLAAFSGGSVHNAGFVGPNSTAITNALMKGNIREVFGLLYILAQNGWVSDALLQGLRNSGWGEAELTQIGFVPDVIKSRYHLVNQTLTLPSEQHYNGIPTFLFAPFDSWVRFDYAGPDETVTPPQWEPLRIPLKPHCNETTLSSDSPLIRPKLSMAELSYQCNGLPQCKLRWYPGKLCFIVQDVPFKHPDSSTTASPGYVERATAQGWRIVAGPSGTTSTLLQLGRMLGIDPRLAQLTMTAWMIRTLDHSLFEIMLGADPFMAKEWSVNYTIADFGTLMPEDIIQEDINKDETIVFKREEIWNAVVRDWLLATPDGTELLSKFNTNQVAYLLSLLGDK